MKKIMLFAFCVALAFSCGMQVYATTYYVASENPTASDSNPGSENYPWLTLGKATITVVAGDTVIVKAGTYIDGSAQSTYPYRTFNPTKSGTSGNPITFRSDPALAATIKAKNWNPSSYSPYLAWCVSGKNYITFDGFKITGGFRAHESGNIIIRNCELTGGFYPPSDPSLNWGIAFEDTSNGLIQNNYVYNMRDAGNPGHNAGCFMIFGNSDNNIIEYNTADGDTTGSAIIYHAYGSKAGDYDDNTFRYNFGKNVVTGFFGIGNTAGTVSVYRNIIHNNIILGADSFIELYKMSIDFRVYNNTAYDCDYFVHAIESSCSGLELWNNLSISTNTNFLRWNTYATPSAIPSNLISYSNYNSSSITDRWYLREASTVRFTLDQWQANTLFGDNNTSTEVSVINAGGISPEDYKRTSYQTDGRGGGYASVIGAYITGNEVVGYVPDSAGVNTSPSSPVEFMKTVQ